jgi:hypothetical protein
MAGAATLANTNATTRLLGKRGAKVIGDGFQRIAATKFAPRETRDALRISNLSEAGSGDEEAQ